MTSSIPAPSDARRALLAGVIDHAPLFPPASMSVRDALAEDRRVRHSDVGWLVNRFVCPLSKLAELRGEPLRLSLVVDAEPEGLDDPRVEALELPPGSDVLAPRHEVYVERPLDGLEWLDDLGARGRRAKVRCGGQAVPSVEALAAFTRRCRELRVPFKATAGLHHPVRRAEQHGFLNLLAAAVFGDEEEALAEDDPSAFGVDRDAFRWRDRLAGAQEVARVRRELFVGFGSCSAQEPADELKALGILP